MQKHKWILILLIFLSFESVAQKLTKSITHISVKNGLSHNNIYAITQDSQGFMWLGSQNGLDKFDGYQFQSYYHDPQDSSTLISANFGKLFTDSKNRIWIGTYTGGLSLYNPTKNEITHFVHDQKNPQGISNDLIRAITEDKDGNIWIGTSNGLNKFIEKDRTFKKYFNEPDNSSSIGSNVISDICIDKKGNMWIGTNVSLDRFDLKTEKIWSRENDPVFTNLNVTNVQSLFTDNEDNLWIGTRNDGLFFYNTQTKSPKHFAYNPEKVSSIGDNRIQCIYQDTYGTIWVGTYNNGLSVFNKEKNDFTHIKNSPFDPKSLSSNTIESIFEDRSANLWVGTRGGGINIIDLKPQKFYNVEKSNSGNSIAGPIVQAIFQQNDSTIWFGTKSGLSLFNIKSGEYTNFISSDDKNSLSNDRVRAIAGNKETIWVGTYYGGLNKITQKDGKFIFYRFLNEKNNINSLSGNQVNTILVDESENVWIGTNGGVDKLVTDFNGKIYFEHYKHIEKDKNTISNTYIQYIYQDQNYEIWICTSAGLDKYLPETNNFKRYTNNTASTSDLDANAFTNIYQDSDKNFWVGTNGGGLYKFYPTSGKFEPVNDGTSKTGSVMGILEDNKKNLWISTQKGISKFDIKTNTFVNYDISDGLVESGFNRNATCKTNNGVLYFGNISGYTIIKPDEIVPNPHKPNVVLTDFKIFNKSIFKERNSFSKQTPSFTKEINLTYNDYVVSFEFASLDFTNPGKNQYSYTLKGFNNDWIDFGNQRNIMFTSLPHGDYTLLIKATNNDGIWCEESNMIAIKLYVKPPFWKTWWFYTILGLTAILAVYLFIVIRTKNLKEKNELLEKKVQERTLELEKTNIELEKLSIVARETDNSVTIMDAKGNFQWINEGFSKVFGYKDIDDFKSQMGSNIIKGKFSPVIAETAKKVIQTKKTIVKKTKIIDKFNNEKWLQTVWTPILNENNELSQIITVDSDITEIIFAEQEIIKQKNILEEKNIEINRHNDNINSSIRYAQTIQSSILPFKNRFDKFSENFIIFIPKDIVSGDFYWFAETENHFFIAVVDCTGHGVPGAFMSLIGSRLLDKIVKDNNVTDPSEILIYLDEYVVSTLKQAESGNRDGMDVGLIRITKDEINKEAIFCGAKQDMLYYNKKQNKVERIRGTRKAIGGISSKRNVELFQNINITITKGDSIYLLSDGYKDQNNKARERFGTGRLMVLLQESIEMPMNAQKEIIINILEKFKEGEKNRDDITILGMRI